MKKVASYPKITTKTNILVTHTQNINVNSPKNMTKKNCKYKDDEKNNNNNNSLQDVANKCKSKIKYSIKTNKPTLNSQRQKSSIPRKKNSKQQYSMNIKKFYSQQDMKKVTNRVKVLEKKLSKYQNNDKIMKLQSTRNLSKIHNNSNNSYTSNFIKNSNSNNNNNLFEFKSKKLLKKSNSDKILIKGVRNSRRKIIKKQQQFLQSSQSNHQSQVINQYITQVSKQQNHCKNQNNNNFYHLYSDKNYTQQQQHYYYYIGNICQCGNNNFYLTSFKQHLIQSIQTISYLSNCNKPTLIQLEPHFINLPPSKFKNTIVLDLDETLIHCNESIHIAYDTCLKIKFPNGEKIDAGINIRPYTRVILQQLSKYAEILIFTASHQCYANVVLDYLDPNKQFISHRLFRNHCWQTEQGVYIKDLRVIRNRSLENILLVDNAAYSYYYQLQNGIPIISYYDNKEDKELLHLLKYFKNILKINNNNNNNNNNNKSIKQINEQYFQMTKYTQFQKIENLITSLYEPIINNKLFTQ